MDEIPAGNSMQLRRTAGISGSISALPPPNAGHHISPLRNTPLALTPPRLTLSAVQLIGTALNLTCCSHQFIAEAAAAILLTIAEKSPPGGIDHFHRRNPAQEAVPFVAFSF
jgi:hypothetical protein